MPVGAGHIDHIEATDSDGRFQHLRADAYVLALGSVSPLLTRPLRISLPVYPAKGYSVRGPPCGVPCCLAVSTPSAIIPA